MRAKVVILELINKVLIMNKLIINKVNKEISKCNDSYSLGFKRFLHLPRKVVQSMQKAALFDGVHINKIHKKCLNFLSGLTEKEFQNWMRLA